MGVLEDKKRDAMNEFYKKIGGSHICSNCSKILTPEQYKESESALPISYLYMAICFIVFSILWTLLKNDMGGIFAGVFIFIFLSLFYKLKKKKGCLICHSNKITHINSTEGRIIFQKLRPDYVNSLPADNVPEIKENL